MKMFETMGYQANLFPETLFVSPSETTTPIEGLDYLEDYISSEEELFLLNQVDAGHWMLDLKRRVQHFGYKYDYKARRIETKMKIGSLPEWLGSLSNRLFREGFFEEAPDQVIANEYEPGQGISPHIDCEPCFAKTIASLSLGSAVVMEFAKGSFKTPVLLKPRSLVLLSGDARFKWTHCIPPRKKDNFNGAILIRKRRVSLTFRKTVL